MTLDCYAFVSASSISCHDGPWARHAYTGIHQTLTWEAAWKAKHRSSSGLHLPGHAQSSFYNEIICYMYRSLDHESASIPRYFYSNEYSLNSCLLLLTAYSRYRYYSLSGFGGVRWTNRATLGDQGLCNTSIYLSETHIWPKKDYPVSSATVEAVDKAVEAARSALQTTWRKSSGIKGGALLMKPADLV
jgi:hypothetical protein